MDSSVLKIQAYYKTVTRTVTIEVGQTYLVDPLNPRCKKNRGRFCVVLGFPSDNYALVAFSDTSRNALVPIRDLTDFEEDIDV